MAQPEPLTSKMRVNHAMVLNVLDQWEGQQAALHTLLLDNHEEPARREALVERAVQVLTSLLRARVVEPDDGSALEDWLPADRTTPDAVAPEGRSAHPADAASGRRATGADGIAERPTDLGPIGELLAAAGHPARARTPRPRRGAAGRQPAATASEEAPRERRRAGAVRAG